MYLILSVISAFSKQAKQRETREPWRNIKLPDDLREPEEFSEPSQAEWPSASERGGSAGWPQRGAVQSADEPVQGPPSPSPWGMPQGPVELPWPLGELFPTAPQPASPPHEPSSDSPWPVSAERRETSSAPTLEPVQPERASAPSQSARRPLEAESFHRLSSSLGASSLTSRSDEADFDDHLDEMDLGEEWSALGEVPRDRMKPDAKPDAPPSGRALVGDFSLRKAFLFTEILGPPRSARPYRPITHRER